MVLAFDIGDGEKNGVLSQYFNTKPFFSLVPKTGVNVPILIDKDRISCMTGEENPIPYLCLHFNTLTAVFRDSPRSDLYDFSYLVIVVSYFDIRSQKPRICFFLFLFRQDNNPIRDRITP